MEDNSVTRGFNFTMELILVIAFVAIVFGAWAVVQVLSNSKINSLTNEAEYANESTYTSLEGQDVTGTVVQSKAKTWSDGDIYVVIVRASSSKIVMYYDEDLSKPIAADKNREIAAGLSNKKSAYYVNPNATFNVSMIYDDDGVLVGVKFTQNT